MKNFILLVLSFILTIGFTLGQSEIQGGLPPTGSSACANEIITYTAVHPKCDGDRSYSYTWTINSSEGRIISNTGSSVEVEWFSPVGAANDVDLTVDYGLVARADGTGDSCGGGTAEHSGQITKQILVFAPITEWQISASVSNVCSGGSLSFIVPSLCDECDLFVANEFVPITGYNWTHIKDISSDKSFTTNDIPSEWDQTGIFYFKAIDNNPRCSGDATESDVETITIYPPAPTIDSVEINSPICKDDKGSIIVHHTSVSDQESFIYTVTQWTEVDDFSGCGGDTLNYNNKKYCALYFDNVVNDTQQEDFDISESDFGTGTSVNFSAGVYSLMIESESGSLTSGQDSLNLPSCAAQSEVFEIIQPTYTSLLPGDITTTSSAPSCRDNNDGSISVSVNSNGLGDKMWSLIKSSSSYQNTNFTRSAGTYTVYVKDQCDTVSKSVTVDPGTEFFPDLSVTQSTCGDSASIEITDLLDVDSNPFDNSSYNYDIEYKKEGGNYSDSDTFDELSPGSTVTIYARINERCVSVTSVDLNDVPETSIAVTDITSIPAVCSNGNGYIKLNNITKKIEGPISIAYTLTESGGGSYGGSFYSENTSYSDSIEVAPGTYEVNVTDACNSNSLIRNVENKSVASVDAINVAVDVVQHAICFSGDGSVSFTISNGTSPYSYIIYDSNDSQVASDSDLSDGDINNVGLAQATDYYIVVEDSCGVSDTSATFSVDLLNSSQITADITYNIYTPGEGSTYDLKCKGDTGGIIVTAFGGNQLSSGLSYIFRLFNSSSNLLVNTSNSTHSEFYSQLAQDSIRFLNLSAGDYFVEIQDANSCISTTNTITITEPANQLTISEIDPNDFLGTDLVQDKSGDLYIQCHDATVSFSPDSGTVSGGVTGYSYKLGDQSFTSTVDISLTTNSQDFTFKVTDDNGCVETELFTLNNPDQLTLDLSIPETYSHGASVQCYFDSLNGIIQASASGGYGFYDFSLFEEADDPNTDDSHRISTLGLTSYDFESLAANQVYQVLAEDDLGCIVSGTQGLTTPSEVTIAKSALSNLNGYNIKCHDGTAALTFTGSGGTGSNYGVYIKENPNAFATSADGSTGGGQTFSESLIAGSYEVYLEDEEQCHSSDTLSFELTDPPALTISASNESPPVCIQGDDGEIEVSATGGVNTTSRKFEIGESLDDYDEDEPNAEAATFYRPASSDGYQSKTYHLKVTDDNGCTANETVAVEPNPNPLTIEVETVNAPSCHIGTDGFIEFEVTNATTADGNVSVYLLGGHVNDSLEWQGPPGTSATFEDLHDTQEDPENSPIPYEIRVYDDNDCPIVQDNIVDGIYLNSPPKLSIDNPFATRPTLEHYNDGWIQVRLSGGTSSGYEVDLNESGFVGINANPDAHRFEDLYSREYVIALRDDNYVPTQEEFCVVYDTVQVDPGRRIDISRTEVSRVSCPGAADGSIQLVVQDTLTGEIINSSLTIQYEILNDPDSRTTMDLFGGSIPELTGLAGNTYEFTVTYKPDSIADNFDPTIYETIVVEEAEPLSFDSFDPINPSCDKIATKGKLQFVVTGGYSDETVYYSLNGESRIPVTRGQLTTIDGLDLNTHEITLSKADGSCSVSRTFEITNDKLEINLVSKSNPTCYGAKDGSIRVSSNVEGAQYQIEEYPDYSESIGFYDTLGAGTYHLIISRSDQNATCLNDTVEITLTEPDALAIEISSVNSNCGQDDGSATATVSGGTAPYEVVWRDENLQEVEADQLLAGEYTVHVTDSLGCELTSDPVVIADVPTISVNSDSQTPASCLHNDGTATITISDGLAPYSINEQSFNSATVIIENLYEGDTLFTISDSRGCEITTTLTIHSENTLQVAVNQEYFTTCDDANGAAKLRVSGGQAPYSFNWGDTTITSDSLSLLSVGQYNVTVTDTYGCEQTVEVNIAASDGIQDATIQTTQPYCDLPNGSIAISTIEGDFAPFNVKLLSSEDTTDLGSFVNSDSLVIDSLAAGQYALLLFDSNSCLFKVNNIELTDDPDRIPTYVYDVVDLSSCGLETGKIKILNETGIAPFEYSWEKEGVDLEIDSAVALNLASGQYDVTITDSTGCPVEIQTFMTDRPAPSISLLSTQSSPIGATNGSLSVALSGGLGSYSYDLDSIENTSGIFQELAPGAYDVSGADSLGCRSDTLTISIAGTTKLDIRFNGSTSATCLESSDGSVLVAASGGLAPYVYTLDGDTVSNQVNGLATGDYYVVVQDSIGSTDSVLVSVPILDSLTVSANTSLVSCEGSCDGQVTLTLDGGSGSYSVSWDHGATGTSLTGLCPGDYFYTVSDNDSGDCLLSGSANIGEQPYLSLEVQAINAPTCFNGDDGSIVVAGMGGSGAYSFSWSTDDSGSILRNKSPGDYMVTVTDNLLGCSYADTITIPNTPIITVTDTTLFQPTCVGGNNGYITLTIANAPGALIEWDRGDFGRTIRNVSAGTYGFTITSSLGCSITGEVEITDRVPLAVVESHTDNLCHGYSGGTITLDISGGTSPYFVEWSNGIRSVNRRSLAAGTYSYVVTDSYQCTYSDEVTISEPDAIEIETLSVTDASCNQLSNGAIEVSVSGGTGSYTFDWSNGATSESATNLEAGSYTLVVTDENGCTTSADYTITEPDYLTVTQPILSDPLCVEAADGTALVEPVGGTTPYSILWGDGQTTMEATGLVAGRHTYVITDAHDCTFSGQVRLTDPPGMQIANVVLSNPICYNDENGEIYFEVIGGSGSYNYKWSGETEATNELVEISSGEYSVTIEDVNGCSISRTFFLENPDELFVTGIPDYVLLCEGGEAVLEPDVEWNSYQWSGPNGDLGTNSRIVVSEQGDYHIDVADEDECPADLDLFVEVSDNALVADFIRVSEAIVYEPVVIVDLSTPIPDVVNWMLPESDNIAVNQQDDAILELVFTEPGDYEVGIEVALSNCSAELYKTISVKEEDSNSRSRTVEAQQQDVNVRMFPNPTKGKFKVYLEAPGDDKFSVQLVNTDKNIIEENILQGKRNYVFDWDFSSSPSGVYFLVVQYGDHVQTKRILVLR